MGHKILQVLLRGFLHLLFRYRVQGLENIPAEGGAIVALNHRSYWDVLFAGSIIRRPLRYMAKSALFKNPLFGWLITTLGAFPIQRGKGDIGAIKSALGILKEGNVMLIFPEGKRVLDGSHIKAKPGVALIATMANVPVVPICISGKYKLWHKITFRIGEPVYLSEGLEKRPDADKLQEMSDKIMNSIYSMEVK